MEQGSRWFKKIGASLFVRLDMPDLPAVRTLSLSACAFARRPRSRRWRAWSVCRIAIARPFLFVAGKSSVLVPLQSRKLLRNAAECQLGFLQMEPCWTPYACCASLSTSALPVGLASFKL